MDGAISDPQYAGNYTTLYGAFGSNEQTSTSSAAQAHYNYGVTMASQITPICADNSTPSPKCSSGEPPAIVFLFIGFSNFDIEIGGGMYDIWDDLNHPQKGQPCATFCPNLDNPGGGAPWNQPPDGIPEQSLLRQVYPKPGVQNVGQHVVLFNGALGDQTLATWDPAGFYTNNPCPFQGVPQSDPECNYDRIALALQTNGFAPNQVQAVFLKSAEEFPQYCLNTSLGCRAGSGQTPDVQTAETFMGEIMRFLKLGEPAQVPPYPVPYPNLKQVFITSRTYGGYGVQATSTHGCLNPEPFAYEEGFAVQHLIVAQIDQTNNLPGSDPSAGNVNYSNAPWFDWGPYIWASGETKRSDGLFWCGGQPDGQCNSTYDVRYGDLADETDYWGDYTHPSAQGANKIGMMLFDWLTGDLNSAQSFMSGWVTPWMQD